MPSAEIALQKKLAALKRHTERIEAVAEFLIRNPELAARATLKRMSTGTGLYFEDKGYIRPVATAPVRLQLERHIEDWDNEDIELKDRLQRRTVLIPRGAERCHEADRRRLG